MIRLMFLCLRVALMSRASQFYCQSPRFETSSVQAYGFLANSHFLQSELLICKDTHEYLNIGSNFFFNRCIIFAMKKQLSAPQKKPRDSLPGENLQPTCCFSTQDACQRRIGVWKVNNQSLVSKIRKEKGLAKFRISWTMVSSTLPAAVGEKNVTLLPANSTLFAT